MFKQLPSKMMKSTKPIQFLLYSRVVLYALFFFAMAEIVYLVNCNDVASVAALVLIGLLTSFFNKNMVVILSVALLLTNILRSFMKKNEYRMSEGFTDDKKAEKPNADEKKEVVDEAEKPEEPAKSGDKKKAATEKLTEEFAEFQTVQKQILEGMKDLNPLLDKAEGFIKKYEQYKKENVEKKQE